MLVKRSFFHLNLLRHMFYMKSNKMYRNVLSMFIIEKWKRVSFDITSHSKSSFRC